MLQTLILAGAMTAALTDPPPPPGPQFPPGFDHAAVLPQFEHSVSPADAWWRYWQCQSDLAWIETNEWKWAHCRPDVELVAASLRYQQSVYLALHTARYSADDRFAPSPAERLNAVHFLYDLLGPHDFAAGRLPPWRGAYGR
jgi:hypothetical protein